MHSTVSRDRGERGAIAVIVALFATLLLIVAAFVVDFGLVRIDRQVDKSASDAATMAGLHALNAGDANPRPFVGVCTAIRYLNSNGARFSGLSDTAGTWTDGNGSPAPANPCTNTTLLNQICTPGSLASWAKFRWAGTLDGEPFVVVIQSGYLLAGGSGFAEDALPAASAENDDSAQGCDQLAVTINQQREPGLGSLATDAALKTSVRSVGRVKQDSGGNAPALLLLQRTGCPVGQVGSVGSGSYIHVFGKISTNGLSQPGTIHADSDGTGSSCGSIFVGKAADGIVAYAAPKIGSPATPDPAKPGSVTTYGGSIGLAIGKVRDSLANVYSAAGLTSAASGTHTDPSGRPRVTRLPVDARYRTGVKSIVTSAQSSIFSASTGVTAANAVSKGYRLATCTGGGAITIPAPALTVASKVFIPCSTAKSIASPAGNAINAGIIVFAGDVAPTTMLMPNATEVYVNGGTDAITLGSGNTFSMHTAGHTNGLGKCQDSKVNGRAKLIMRSGGVKQTGGVLRLCNTTMVLMGGQSTGCVPATDGTAPTLTACGGGIGSGQLKINGGEVDWTAPNVHDVMTLASGDPDPALAPSWSAPEGPEDLALWSESGANSSSNTAIMGGGGGVHVQGVFMVPNYQPFTITGGAVLDLINAQFIATSLELNGATSVKMSVDPNAAVTLPKLTIVGLVR